MTLNRALEIASQILTDAAVRVADLFNSDEWAVLGAAFEDQAFRPEAAGPGRAFADLVAQARTRKRIPDRLDMEAFQSILSRLESLGYAEAWAVIISCRWRLEMGAALADGDPWWELGFRATKLEEARGAA